MEQMRQALVLAVDGSEEDRTKLKNILASRVNFFGVAAGSAGLAYVEQKRPDLVLLADDLPDMDGFEVLRRIREDERFKEIPVIMMTMDQSQKAEAASIMAGAFEIVRKPFVPIIVVKKVEQVLELEYLHRHLRSEVRRQTHLAEERLASSQRLFEETVMALAKTIDATIVTAYVSNTSMPRMLIRAAIRSGLDAIPVILLISWGGRKRNSRSFILWGCCMILAR